MRYAQGGGLTLREQEKRERLRLDAAERFACGEKTEAIARELRVTARSARRWRRAWEQGGADALRSRGPVHGMAEVLDVVELLTSELVTNAYLHAKGPASLRLTALGEGRLRVGVWDSHPYIPAPFAKPPGDRVPPGSVGAGGGRGLFLVQEFADSWGGWSLGGGLLDRGAGKLLWFGVGGRAAM